MRASRTSDGRIAARHLELPGYAAHMKLHAITPRIVAEDAQAVNFRTARQRKCRSATLLTRRLPRVQRSLEECLAGGDATVAGGQLRITASITRDRSACVAPLTACTASPKLIVPT